MRVDHACGHCRGGRAWRNARSRRRFGDQPRRLDASSTQGRPGRGRRRRWCRPRSFASLATALTRRRRHRAAAAPAAHDRHGHAGNGGQRLLGFGGADKADGNADHRGRAAARPAPAVRAGGTTRSARCRSRPPSPPVARATIPPPPPCAWCRVCARQRRHLRIGQRADHVIVGRQPRPGDAVRHHLGVAEDRRARRSSAARRGRREIRVNTISCGDLDHAAGMDDPHRDLLVRRRNGQFGLGADDRERTRVDRRAIADVVEAS